MLVAQLMSAHYWALVVSAMLVAAWWRIWWDQQIIRELSLERDELRRQVALMTPTPPSGCAFQSLVERRNEARSLH